MSVKAKSVVSLLVRKRTLMMLLLFVVIFTTFAIRSDGLMVNRRNLMQILDMMAISAFLTQGVALLMISGRLDLSTGANGTLCGMILATLLREGASLVPAILVALAVGALIGLINAILVNELNMAPFIATLATSLIATGFVVLIAQNRIVHVTNLFLINFGRHRLFGYFPISAVVAFASMALIGVLLHKTKFGRQIYLVGGNPQASMLTGINPKKMSYILFVICGLFSSVAGITLISRLQSANVHGLVAQRFLGITAAVLGGISLGGGAGGMGGAFVGLLVISTFTNGMTVNGISPYWQHVASGSLLILALTLEYFQKQHNSRVVA